jgi:hypothetical protein
LQAPLRGGAGLATVNVAPGDRRDPSGLGKRRKKKQEKKI